MKLIKLVVTLVLILLIVPADALSFDPHGKKGHHLGQFTGGLKTMSIFKKLFEVLGGRSNYSDDIEDMPEIPCPTIDNPRPDQVRPTLEKLTTETDNEHAMVLFSLNDTDWIQVMIHTHEDKTFVMLYCKQPELHMHHINNTPLPIDQMTDNVIQAIQGDWGWVEKYGDWIHDDQR